MKISILFLSVFIIFFTLSGCLSVRNANLQTESLQPSVKMKFSDIPSPAGFKIVSNESFVLESGEMRAGMLRYIGRAEAGDVVLFYKSQMPRHNWALLNVLEYGDRMLNFERENEGCVVTIRTKGKRVEISVSLAPKSPMPVPEMEPEVEAGMEIGEGKSLRGRQEK